MKTLFLAVCFSIPVLAQTPRFVYPVPPDSSFSRRNIIYNPGTPESYSFDLYKPAKQSGSLPVVIFVNIVGKMLGPAPFRDHPQYVGWGKAVTSIGYAAVVMESDPKKPIESFDKLIAYLQKNAATLGIDATRIVIYSCSANVQAGMPILTDPERLYLQGALVFYGSGKVNHYRMDLPVMVFRAGLDNRNLNAGIDEIVAGALRRNAPWSLVNGSVLHHGFEVFDDNEQSRSLVRQALTFIQESFDPRLQRTPAMLNEAEAAGLAFSGDWKQAAESYQRMVAADPQNSFAHWRLAEALAAQSDHLNAITHFRQALVLGNGNVGMISVAAAKEALAVGDKEAALEFLKNVKTIRVIADHLGDDPAFSSLRGDPRFAEITAH